MIPNSKAFNGNQFYEDNGHRIYRWHHIIHEGNYLLKIKIVSTNSQNKQGIAIFSSGFSGSILLNGKSLPPLKTKFAHYTFKVDEIADCGLCLEVKPIGGHLYLANASERIHGGSYECGSFGCAFWIERTKYEVLRFHCNDHEYDDDFNDLIFDMEIESLT